MARITPHQQGAPPFGEVNPANNEAQSNYHLVWTIPGSPFSRARVPVTVSNPHPDRPVDVALHIEQTLDYFRTYVSATSVRLSPGESQAVEVMVECIAGESPHEDIDEERLYGTPNVITVITELLDEASDTPMPAGSATVEAFAGRQTTLANLDIDRTNSQGYVLLVDGSPVTNGAVVVASRAGPGSTECSYEAWLDQQGRFHVETPDFSSGPSPLTVDVIFPGTLGFAPSERTILLP